MLTGTIFLTDNIEIVYQTPMDGSVKIINMDEEHQLPENNPNIVPGTNLLPPIDAKIAEADGNEMMYNQIYSYHLLDPNQQAYIGALIGYLYKGGNLLVFLPEQYTNTKDKFIEFMWIQYGIKIGVIGAQNPMEYQCTYNPNYIPLWTNMLYKSYIISPEQFLLMLPANVSIKQDPGSLNKLRDDLRPLGRNINEQFDFLEDYHQKLHKKPNLRIPIMMMEM